MIDWKEIPDGDTWELFARDFLIELGFVIEIGPGRGADAGRDLLVSEQLRGALHSRRFNWLVSCKHFANSGKSVGPENETNIIDRIRHHKAHGFMGFYSTLPSAALITRLQEYANNNDLESYELFDHKKIDSWFIDTGLSKLAFRYFPESYRQIRHVQLILGEFLELRCDVCGADVLKRSVTEPFSANLVWAMGKSDPTRYENLYIACKGMCDERLERRLYNQGFMTNWEDIGDLCNPILYLRNTLSYMNMLRANPTQFSDAVHERMKEVYMSLAQRTLREVTKEDLKRFADLSIFEGVV